MTPLKQVRKIVIHCSASDFGTAAMIDRWHKEFGWDMIGYHRVIGNGHSDAGRRYEPKLDGRVEMGRILTVQGAHAKRGGHNADSIGICLIGNWQFTDRQLNKALPDLLFELCEKYKLTSEDVVGHYELDDTKTCPNIAMDGYRDFLRWYFEHKCPAQPVDGK